MNNISEDKLLMEYNGKTFLCQLDCGMEFIRGKWKAVILCHIDDGPKRFLELQRMTCNISQKVLNEQLKELEDCGLVKKTIFPEVHPRVEYELTEKGQDILPALRIVEKWAEKYILKN